MTKIAIDIGGTYIRIMRNDHIHKFKNGSFKEIFPLMIKEIKANTLPISFIGVSCCGIIEKGIIKKAVNLTQDWQNLDLKQALKNNFPNATIQINNDVDIAALGQYLLLKDKPKKVLYFTFSTGISAGFILNGQIYNGFEIYNTLPDYDYNESGINSGIEFFAGGNGLINQAEKYNLNVNTTKELFDLAIQGNVQAQLVIKTAENKIKSLLSTCVDMLNLDLLIIGGGLALNQPHWFVHILHQVEITTNKHINWKFALDNDLATLKACLTNITTKF